MGLTMSTRMQTAAIRDVDTKMMKPVFVLSLARRSRRLGFSSMPYILLYCCPEKV